MFNLYLYRLNTVEHSQTMLFVRRVGWGQLFFTPGFRCATPEAIDILPLQGNFSKSLFGQSLFKQTCSMLCLRVKALISKNLENR